MEVRKIVMTDSSRRCPHKDVSHLRSWSRWDTHGRERATDKGPNFLESDSRGRHVAHGLSLQRNPRQLLKPTLPDVPRARADGDVA